ncbi:MAG: hypothetical protein JO282_14040 [Alphaproteobacteria bacterium]|nr:hypothetical protein [Alphaproteobacteria bacterium]
MQQLSEPKARPRRGRALAIAAALLCATAFSQPNLAYAGPHGGGGGGGFHGGMGGFHGGGFHGGGFAGSHGGGFHGDRFHDGRFDHDRFGNRRFFFGGAVGYPWWGYYGDYGYPDYGYYDYSQPYSSQTWYYCSDPAGYYPYVTQCNTGWQAVPAS